MKKELNLIEKLKELQGKERKRRDLAVKYLEDLVEILKPVFYEIEGVKLKSCMIDPALNTDAIWIFGKEEEGSDLYFRYGTHYGDDNNVENIGFYISTDYTQVWGENLLYVTGNEFWSQLKRITDWVTNCLPYLKKKMSAEIEYLWNLKRQFQKKI